MASLEEISRDLNFTQSNLDSFTTRWNNVESHLSAIQSRFQMHLQSLNSQQEALNSLKDSLNSKEFALSSQEAALNSKAEALNTIEKALDSHKEILDSHEKALVEKEQALDSKENSLTDREKALLEKEQTLALRELTLITREESLVSNEKSVISKEKAVSMKEEALVIRENEVVSREREIKLKTQEGNSNFKVKVEPPLDDLDIKESSANLRFSVCMDGKGLQMFLNDRVVEHDRIRDEVYVALQMSADPAKLVLDAMEGFYRREERLDNRGVGSEICVVRKSCVLLLEQLIRVNPRVTNSVREEAKRVAKEWEGNVGDANMEVLGFLLILAAYGLVSEFDGEKIARLFGILPKDMQFISLRCTLGIPDEFSLDTVTHSTLKNVKPIKMNVSSNGTINSIKKIEQPLPENMPEKNTVSKLSWPEIRSFCIAMDGHGLRSFLSYHVCKHKDMQIEIFYALQCAPDPTKLVLDAIRDLPSTLSKRKLNHHRISCILLLEQLMRLSPQVATSLKEEAMKTAVSCKESLAREKRNPHEALLFLQLIATFGLASSFDVDELVHLSGVVSKEKRTLELFQALGVVDNIDRFIRSIIKKGQHLEAIRHIYEFGWIDKFPPVHLLEAHVNISKIRAKKIAEEENNSLQSLNKAVKKELEALRAAVKCVAEHKLDSQYPIENLYDRISELEKQNVCGEGTEESTFPSVANHSFRSGKKRPRVTLTTSGPSKVSVNCDSPIADVQLPGKKKDRGIVLAAPAPFSDVQPHIQNDTKSHLTTVSPISMPTVSFGTASITPSLQPLHHLTNPGASYPSTSTGYYNFGFPNLSALHMGSLAAPFPAAGPSYVSPPVNPLFAQQAFGGAANGNMVPFNFSRAYSVGMHAVEGKKIIEESSERGKSEEARGDKKEKDNMHDGAETARFNHNYEKTKIDGSGGCYETTIYPDPEFTDFGKMRAEECFDVGQLWAVYDNSIDGMPRFYAQVRRVFSPVFKLSITWLEPDPDDGAETDGKAGDRPYACGNFTYGTSNLISERLIFSHQVCFRNDENGRSFVIYPHVGETWAVSLSWDINWKSNFDCHKAPHRFEFVEILSEFNVSDGIKFAKLKKVEGFVSLFHKAEEHGSFQISPSEILRFSHQIPSSKMTGKEREGVPEGSFELDPASLPADVYGTVAFSDAEKTVENLASGFNALCGCNDLGSSPKMQTTSRSDKIDSEVDKLKQRSAVKSSDRRKKRNQDNASQHLNLGARNKDSKASLGKCNNQGESKLDALCQAVDILEETKNC